MSNETTAEDFDEQFDDFDDMNVDETSLEAILFLDDNPDRCKAFLDYYPDATVVRTAADCITLLKARGWTEVHLDHDLNGGVYEDPKGKNTGSEVVRWMALNKPDVLTCVVQTHNERQMLPMANGLKRAGYHTIIAPFILLQ